MKISFECSPEEREMIIQQFEALCSEHPIKEQQDLINIISTVLLNILNSAKESMLQMTISLVKETLEQGSAVYQALINNLDENEVWNGTEESDDELVVVDAGESNDEVQKILDAWNKAVKNKQYLVADRTYKS